MKASIVKVTLKLERVLQNRDKNLPSKVDIEDMSIACKGMPSKIEYMYSSKKENFIHPSTLNKLGINVSTRLLIDNYKLASVELGKSLGIVAFEVDDTYSELKGAVEQNKPATPKKGKVVPVEITEVFNDDDWG